MRTERDTNDGQHGRELWKTDGTTVQMVSEIRPRPAGSGPSWLTVVGNRIYFAANDGQSGPDGITATLIEDIGQEAL